MQNDYFCLYFKIFILKSLKYQNLKFNIENVQNKRFRILTRVNTSPQRANTEEV